MKNATLECIAPLLSVLRAYSAPNAGHDTAGSIRVAGANRNNSVRPRIPFLGQAKRKSFKGVMPARQARGMQTPCRVLSQPSARHRRAACDTTQIPCVLRKPRQCNEKLLTGPGSCYQ